MSDPALSDGGAVTELPIPAQVMQEEVRAISALFPGWKVWYCSCWPATWNAYRKGEKPYFGPGAAGRQFMMTAYSAARLLTLLQEQVRIDIAAEFPEWRVKQNLGGWVAVCHKQRESDGEAVVQLVHRSTIAGLHRTLRARRDSEVIGHGA